jgi:dTDP-4-amino-4,6-dideoxygalactose transaminase
MSRPKPVPLLDLTAQYAPLREEIQSVIARICDAQQFVLGPEVKAFERETAEYSGVRHGLGVSSGTDALLLALMALGVGPGDAVITTPFTFFATAGVVARLGARPLFCDIDPATFNLSADAVAAYLATACDRQGSLLVDRASGTVVKALLPVHLYGQMADMDALGALAREADIAIVEDAAQAIGAADPAGRRAGSIGDIGCFSFFPTKNLGAFGDAGMCVTGSDELAERMRILRVHGGEPKYYHALIGGNFRIDELQAAVLRIKLRHLDAWTAARQRNADRYDAAFAAAGLGDRLTPPHRVPGGRHIFNQYVVRVRERDALRSYLAEHQIGSEIYYPLSLHQQACFAYLGYGDGDLPESSRAAAEVLALPIYPELDPAQIDRVAATVCEFFQR